MDVYKIPDNFVVIKVDFFPLLILDYAEAKELLTKLQSCVG